MSIAPRKIRLSIFLRRPRSDGNYSVERLFDAVIAALPQDRYEVSRYVCPFESNGLIRRLASIIWAAFHQGDVNHVTGDVNFLGLLMRHSRTVLTILDSASVQRLSGWRRWLYVLLWLRLPIARAARITAISEATLQEALSYVKTSAAKFTFIPCCLPAGLSLQPKSFSVDCPRFLVVGTKPNKNLPRIIEALAGLPCSLVVIGPLDASHHQLIALHRVQIENHVGLNDAAMSLQYQLADAVLFVSTYEGFGLPILEAQAVGRPLVTSRLSPMQEVAGAGACLVDPESVEEIRAAIMRLLADTQYVDALVQSGLRNVQTYTPRAIAARYALVYEEMYCGATL